MKITKKNEELPYTRFGELDDGDAFIDPAGMGEDAVVLVKCGSDWDNLLRNDDEFDWIAVRLDNGDIYGYKNDEKVVKVDVSATFTVNTKGE